MYELASGYMISKITDLQLVLFFCFQKSKKKIKLEWIISLQSPSIYIYIFIFKYIGKTFTASVEKIYRIEREKTKQEKRVVHAMQMLSPT